MDDSGREEGDKTWIKTFPLSSTCKRRRIPVDLFYSRMNQLRDVKSMETARLWANFDGTRANVTPLSATIGGFVKEG